MINPILNIIVFYTSGAVIKYKAYDYERDNAWFSITDENGVTLIPIHSIDEIRIERYDATYNDTINLGGE